MAIPDFQTLMRPILAQLQDGQPRAIADVRAALVGQFGLTEEDLAEELPSGRVKTFQNRVGWATTYLYRTGLLTRPRRSVYAITERGQQVLAANSERVDLRVLAQFPELAAFRSTRQVEDEHEPEPPDQKLLGVDDEIVDEATPQERIANAYRELRAALIAELLDSIREQDSDFFEKLVVDVLQAMGYGGSREDAAERLGQSGDEASTASSARIASAWIRSTCKPRSGAIQWGGRRFRSSSGRSTGNARRKASSSLRLPSPAGPAISRMM